MQKNITMLRSTRCASCRQRASVSDTSQCADCGLTFCTEEAACTSEVFVCSECNETLCNACSKANFCSGNGSEGYCPHTSTLCDTCSENAICQGPNQRCVRMMCSDCAFDVKQDDDHICSDCRPVQSGKKKKVK